MPSGAPEVKTKARAKLGRRPSRRRRTTTRGGGGRRPRTTSAGQADASSSSITRSPRARRATSSARPAREVLDRTGVIVDIFHRHARSREARLQVEIARLNYVAPRMRESPGGKERQRGQGRRRGGASSSIGARFATASPSSARSSRRSRSEQENRRHARQDQLRVALVGYTNAGKSSLMRALTGSEVLVEDKLFATLDTTVRALQPETKPRVLVSDTVGFIKKLPHDLVASFRSTLDEALEASLLLYVVDASDPTHEAAARGDPRRAARDRRARRCRACSSSTRPIASTHASGESLLRRHAGEDVMVVSAHDPRDVARAPRRRFSPSSRRRWSRRTSSSLTRSRLSSATCTRAPASSRRTTTRAARASRVRGLPAAIARLRRSFEA